MTADLKQAAQIALLALEYHTQQTRPITQTEEAIKVLMEALADHRAQSTAEAHGLLREFDQLLQAAERAEHYLASTPLPVASDVYSALSHACDQARRVMAEALETKAQPKAAEGDENFQAKAAALRELSDADLKLCRELAGLPDSVQLKDGATYNLDPAVARACRKAVGMAANVQPKGTTCAMVYTPVWKAGANGRPYQESNFACTACGYVGSHDTHPGCNRAKIQSPAPAPESSGAKLALCPFCGRRPVLTVRPDNAEATSYFAAVACFCDGYAACAHKDATASEADEAERLVREKWNRRTTAAPAVQDEKTPAGYNRPPNGEPAHPEDWNAGYEAGLADGHEAGLHSGKLAVAWLYEHDGSLDEPILTASRWPECREPWNETPLDALALAKHAIEKVWFDAVGTVHGEHSISEAARKRVEFAAEALKLGLRLPGALRKTCVESPISNPKGSQS